MKPLTSAQFWSGMALLVAVFGAITIGIRLHWSKLMKDELRQEQERAWRWAKKEARRLAIEILRNAEINFKPKLINESDINWGRGDEDV